MTLCVNEAQWLIVHGRKISQGSHMQCPPNTSLGKADLLLLSHTQEAKISSKLIKARISCCWSKILGGYIQNQDIYNNKGFCFYVASNHAVTIPKILCQHGCEEMQEIRFPLPF